MSISSIPQKQCSKCGVFKPETVEYFTFIKRYNHFNHICRICVRQRDTDWRRRKGILPKNKPLTDNTKGCAKCGRVLPLSKFYLQANGKYAVYCADCKTTYSQAYYHKDIELSRERSRVQTIKHREKNQLRRSRNYQNYRRATIEWIKNNRDKVNTSIHKRRALKQGLPHDLPVGKQAEIISRFDGRCAICGRAESNSRIIVLDHWIAIKSDAKNNPGTVENNLVPICHGVTGCNNSKRNQMPLDWLMRKFGDEGYEIYTRIERYLARFQNGNCTNNI